MRYVDIDDDTSTFDSSAATLSLPPGASVLFAGLYYGGRTQAGSGGSAAPNANLRNKVLLRPPNLPAYIPLTASVVDDAPVNPSAGAALRLYQGFVDVTDIVRSGGAGEYTVADVQLGTGLEADQSGGWALAVAYEDSSQPTRNLTIFDGFEFVSTDVPAAERPVDITLSGFVTPVSGPVSTRIGLVALEGDLGTSGDSATINAVGAPGGAAAPPCTPTSPAPGQPCRMTNGTNPADNFFNASISTRTAAPFHLKNPDYLNQFGFDADVFDATGRLANGQGATTIRLDTNGDGYAPQAISFATDLFAPSLNVVKAVDHDTARSGDELTYTVDVSNVGLDAATNTTLRDVIPSGTKYVPGSMSIDGVGKSDAAGDDQAEFDGTAKTVVMRIGDRRERDHRRPPRGRRAGDADLVPRQREPGPHERVRRPQRRVCRLPLRDARAAGERRVARRPHADPRPGPRDRRSPTRASSCRAAGSRSRSRSRASATWRRAAWSR